MLKSWEKYKNSEKVKFCMLLSLAVILERMHTLKLDCLCLISEKKTNPTLKE